MNRWNIWLAAVWCVIALGLSGGCPQESQTAAPADSAQAQPGTVDLPAAAGDQPALTDGEMTPSLAPTLANDQDGDGLADTADPYPNDFFNNDFDEDGVPDDVDNCFLYNPDQLDLDTDGFGDLCEAAIVASSAPVTPVLGETILVAQDGQFLGVVSTNPFDSDSLANSFGTFGNRFSSYSIWNEFGTYGSPFSMLSPWNAYTSTPPILIENGTAVGYLTVNAFLAPRLHPNDLAIVLGRGDALR